MRLLSVVLCGLSVLYHNMMTNGFNLPKLPSSSSISEIIHHNNNHHHDSVISSLQSLINEFQIDNVHQTEQQLLDKLRAMSPLAPHLKASEGFDATASLPIVFVHGMGDSCFNAGMKSLPKLATSFLNTYSVCIPGGDNLITDTLSAFLVTMDANVDYFAKQVAADPKLADGFYGVGLSQGNAVLRGYMQKYNAPALVRVLHIHGTLEGVAAFPRCPNSIVLCQKLTTLLGSLAYNPLVQSILFQANYFRDPTKTNSTEYQTNSQIAQWNGEGNSFDPSQKTNFLKTQQLTLIKAEGDTMIDPKESEWWGSYASGSFSDVLTLRDTAWYADDTFGLKTLDLNGRLSFNTSTGNHLQFTSTDLENWMIQAGFGQ